MTRVHVKPSPTPRRTGYAGFAGTLKLVGTGPRGSRDLTSDEAREALRAILAGEVTLAQTGAFLVATRIKGESPEELAGYAQALRDAAAPLEAATARPLVACAGAYDGAAEAPHLSLAAAAVAAACGAGIVIHCGPRLGPKYGITALDVLASLGGQATEPEAMLARAGVAVVDTSHAVTGWRELLRVRNEVGLRGPVHSAEKLIDYFGADAFVVGYTHSAYADRLLGALRLLGARRAVAIRGVEGSDIIRPGRPVAHDLHGRIELPERLGETIREPGGVDNSARLTVAILDGSHRGPERSAVVISAALRLHAAGITRDPRDGFDLADGALADGGALATLHAIVTPRSRT